MNKLLGELNLVCLALKRDEKVINFATIIFLLFFLQKIKLFIAYEIEMPADIIRKSFHG
jgi:hypothetical protein